MIDLQFTRLNKSELTVFFAVKCIDAGVLLVKAAFCCNVEAIINIHLFLITYCQPEFIN